MALCRLQLQCVVSTVFMHLVFMHLVFMHLCAIHCNAQPPIETTLSVCDYSLTNLYVVNTTEPSTIFPTGYVSCINATGSDTEVCKICSCRENKVGSAAGVTVTGAVCVGSGDATTCVGQEQTYCDCNDSARCTVGTVFLRDGSSNNEAFISGGDVVVSTDSGNPTNDSDTSAENNSTSSPSLSLNFTADSATDNALLTIDNRSSSDGSLHLDTNMDTTIPVLAPKSVNLSIDTDPGSSKTDNHSESGGDSTDDGSRSTDSNTTNTNASIHASIDTDTDSISKPASPSISYGSKVTEPPVGNDNVASDVVGTVKPSQTNTALLKDQNIAPEENGSTLGTNSGSASKSSWSGERITTVISTICGTGVVAAIAVFVAIRRGQSKKIMEIRTPTDDYANDGTPTNFGGHGATYYSGGNHTVDSFAHTPLAAIAVIGSDDAFLNSPSSESKHQYRSYAGAERNASEDYYACTDSHKDVVVRPSSTAIQPQFLASNDPSISDLLSPTSDPIFDTTYSRESFSSDMSSQSESPSDELFRESDLSFDSFRVTCETSRGTDHDSNSSTHSRNRQASSDFKENVAGSSVSSLDSVQYDFRDTKVSENMRELEMETGSSRIAISFDMDSYDSKGL